MTTTDPAIRDFLERYAATLTRFEATAGADLWAMPAVIVDDRFAGVITSRQQMSENLRRSYPLYRELGLARVGCDLRDVRWLTDVLVMVEVRWLFYDAHEELLTDSTSHYLLRRTAAGFQACVCVQVDDVEKLDALARRLN